MYQPFDALPLTGRCISVIGSGGKTTLLRYLSARHNGTVILTTSTHIYPFAGIPLVTTSPDAAPADRGDILPKLREALSRNRVVCLGRPLPSGKLASPAPAIPFEELLREADVVLIEADGAAGRPLKAHRPWEPVIPACTDLTVCVAGASGIGKPVPMACHCPELFAGLAGISPHQPVDEASIARVINREDLADLYLVNQVDALPDPARAARLCELIQKPASPCSLISRIR